MCNILFGEEFVQNNTVMTSLININSPMVFDDIMMGAMEVYAENNQACIVLHLLLVVQWHQYQLQVH